MAIAVLSVDLVAKVASFEKDLQRVARTSQESADKMAQAFGIAKAGLGGLVSGIAAGFSVNALKTMFRETINGLDALNDLRDATGASIENLSALEDVAARTGNSFESVASTLVKFNKILSDAKPGSQTAAILKSIGLDAQKLQQIDPAEALRQTAVALANYADDGNKARVVQELFGKSVREAAPLLNDLASQTALVGKVTEEQTKAAEKFNQELAKMAKNSQDTARSIVSAFLPLINKRLEAGNKEGFLAFFGFDQEFFDKKKLADAAAEVRQLDSYLQKLNADKAGGIGYFSNVDEQIRRVTADLERAKAAFRALDPLTKQKQAEAALAGSAGDYSNEGRDRPKPSVPVLDSQAFTRLREQLQMRQEMVRAELQTGEPLKEADKLRIELLRQINDSTLEVTESERARLRGMALKLVADTKLNTQAKESLKRVQEESRALAEENLSRQEANKRLEEEVESIGLNRRQLDELVVTRLEHKAALEEEKIATLSLFNANAENLGQMRQNLAEMRRTIALRRQAAATTDAQARDALKGAGDALDAYAEKARNVGDATRDAVTRSLGQAEDTLTELFTKGKTDVKQFVDTIISEFVRLRIVKPLLADLFGGGSSGNYGSILQSLFGGGSSGASYPSIAGGAGDSAGYVIPSAGPSSAGGRMSVGNTYNIQVGSDVSRGEVYDAVTKAVAASEGRQMQRMRAAGVA